MKFVKSFKYRILKKIRKLFFRTIPFDNLCNSTNEAPSNLIIQWVKNISRYFETFPVTNITYYKILIHPSGDFYLVPRLILS